jgi:hypothetical protein
MECSKCRKEAVIYQRYSGLRLCRDHFIADVEAKAKREIRRRRWLATGDVIAVVLRGDPASAALLHFLVKVFGGRPDISISALLAADGARKVAGDHGISCHDVTGGQDLETAAHDMGATKIAVGTTLDDIALEVLVTVLEGHADRLAGAGETEPSAVPRIAPFSIVPAEEVALYAHLTLENVAEAPATPAGLAADVRALLDDYTARHPATKFALKNLEDELAGICEERGGVR